MDAHVTCNNPDHTEFVRIPEPLREVAHLSLPDCVTPLIWDYALLEAASRRLDTWNAVTARMVQAASASKTADYVGSCLIDFLSLAGY